MQGQVFFSPALPPPPPPPPPHSKQVKAQACLGRLKSIYAPMWYLDVSHCTEWRFRRAQHRYVRSCIFAATLCVYRTRKTQCRGRTTSPMGRHSASSTPSASYTTTLTSSSWVPFFSPSCLNLDYLKLKDVAFFPIWYGGNYCILDFRNRNTPTNVVQRFFTAYVRASYKKCRKVGAWG